MKNLFTRNSSALLFFITTIVILLLATYAEKAAAYQNLKPDQDYVAGEMIVKFKPVAEIVEALRPLTIKPKTPTGPANILSVGENSTLGIGALRNLVSKFGLLQIEPIVPTPQFIRTTGGKRIQAKILRLPDLSTLVKIKYPKEIELSKILSAFNADPHVVYAEPNYIYKVDQIIPDDSRFADQWAFHNTGQTGGTEDGDIDAPEAWEIQKGDTSVIVGIVDTGIDYNHPDLAANIWTNWGEVPNNRIDDDGNGYVDDIHGWDFLNLDNNPIDDQGHGTHVAGTVGAVSNNEKGVTGTAWYVRLMALKFLGAKSGSNSGIIAGTASGSIAAIYYGANNGARVLNNSWGGGGYSQALQEAINYANSLGVLFIASAGNENDEATTHYPSNMENSFGVASTDHNDKKSGFSNYGTWVEISAPGSSILSTWPGGKYASISGTSMASPHVSGLAALLFAEHPDWTPLQVQTQIENTADDLDAQNPLYVGKLGAGRINAYNALLPPTARVIISDYVIDDNQFGQSGGNADGIINPGEKIELFVSAKNVGSITATQVEIRFRANSPYIFIEDSTSILGDLIFSGGEAEADPPFRFEVASIVPAGSSIPLNIYANDALGKTWNIPLTLPVYSSRTRIFGKVMDAATGLTIPAARVEYNGTLSGFVMTGANGMYSISDLLDGSYEIQVNHPDFELSEIISIDLPSNITEIDFRLGVAEVDLNPQQFEISHEWGSSAERELILQNIGTMPLHFRLFELPHMEGKQSGKRRITAQQYEAVLQNNETAINTDPSVKPWPGLENSSLMDKKPATRTIQEVMKQWQKLMKTTLGNVPTIKAVVLESFGNANPAVFRELNLNWPDLGPLPLLIDYIILNKPDISYEDIAATEADVLIVSNAYDAAKGWEFTYQEQQAIEQYLAEGNGIVFTGGTLYSNNVSGHTAFFARLAGLSQGAFYQWPGREFIAINLQETNSRLYQSMENAYIPGQPVSSTPTNGDWRDFIVDGKLVGASVNGHAAIIRNDRNVFLSNLPEESSNQFDRQLLYNSIMYAASEMDWLQLSQYWGTVTGENQLTLNLSVTTTSLTPQQTYSADLLIASNDLNDPFVRVPISVTPEDAAVIRLKSLLFDDDESGDSIGDSDGHPNAGERVELHVLFVNQGTQNALDLSASLSTVNPYISIVNPNSALADLTAGSSTEVTFLSDFLPDYPTQMDARLTFIIRDAFGTLWTDSISVTVQPASSSASVSGFVEINEANQSGVKAIVHYSGTQRGTVEVQESGNYYLYLKNGDYLIWAEGPGLVANRKRSVRVPPGNHNLNFNLGIPQIQVDTESIAATLDRAEKMARTIRISNNGTAPLRFHLSSEEVGNTTSLPSRISVFMDESPHGVSNVVLFDLLKTNVLNYDVLKSTDIGVVNLSQYKKVIIAGAQPRSFWDKVFLFKTWFENYLAEGGMLDMHSYNGGTPDNVLYLYDKAFPGNFVVSIASMNPDFPERTIFNPIHPMLSKPNTISIENLNGWFRGSSGAFSEVPTIADTVLATDFYYHPILLEARFGDGVILATTFNVDWPPSERKLAENLLLFGLKRATWLTESPHAGYIMPGEHLDVNISLNSVASLTPNKSYEGLIRIQHNVAGMDEITIPVTMQANSSPALALKYFRLDDSEAGDGDSMLDANEQAKLFISLENFGDQNAMNATGLLATSKTNVNILQANSSFGSIQPNQSAEGGAFIIEASQNITDGELVDFFLSVTAANGYNENIVLPSIKAISDIQPPAPVADLTVNRIIGRVVELSWTATGDDGNEGTVVMYDLRYATELITENNFSNTQAAANLPKALPAGESMEAKVAELSNDVLYYFALRAKDDAGNFSAISNVVTATPKRILELLSHSVTGLTSWGANSNNTAEAGEYIGIDFTVRNLGNETIENLSFVADTSFDDYVYKGPFYPYHLINTIGDVLPNGEASAKYWAIRLPLSSEAPVGHLLTIPLAFYANNNLIDYDTLRIIVEGPDEIAPTPGLKGLSSQQVAQGAAIAIYLTIFEPGPVEQVEAVILSATQEEITRLPMRINPNLGSYEAIWRVDRVGDFHVSFYTEDSQGNSTLFGANLGFSSKPFQRNEKILIVLETSLKREYKNYNTFLIPAFNRMGLKYDLWDFWFRGKILAEQVQQYRDGMVFYFAVDPDILMNPFQSEVLNGLLSYLDKGGALFLASQKIADDNRLSPIIADEYFGFVLKERSVQPRQISGVSNDPIGENLFFTIERQNPDNAVEKKHRHKGTKTPRDTKKKTSSVLNLMYEKMKNIF